MDENIRYLNAEAAKHIDNMQKLSKRIIEAITAGNQEEVSKLLDSFDDLVNNSRNYYGDLLKKAGNKGLEKSQEEVAKIVEQAAERGKSGYGKITGVALGGVAVGGGLAYLWHRHQQKKHPQTHDQETPWTERLAADTAHTPVIIQR